MMIGQIIGNYKILEKISEDEMIELYNGVDLLLNRNVVIKVLCQAGLNQSVIQKSFWFEAATLAKLNHPCIPTLHSMMSLERELVMIFEFTDGETLNKNLLRREKLLCKEAVSIFAQVLDCLDYSHTASITTTTEILSSVALVRSLSRPKASALNPTTTFIRLKLQFLILTKSNSIPNRQKSGKITPFLMSFW